MSLTALKWSRSSMSTPSGRLRADGPRVLLLEPGQAEPPVVGVGQRVDRGEPLEAVVGQGVVDGEPEVGPELLDEREGVVGRTRWSWPARSPRGRRS